MSICNAKLQNTVSVKIQPAQRLSQIEVTTFNSTPHLNRFFKIYVFV